MMANETIRQINGIAGADNDAVSQEDEAEYTQGITDMLEEGNNQVGSGRQLQGEAAKQPLDEELHNLMIVRRRNRKGDVDRRNQADE
jgi:hypothetical protein